MTEKNTGSWLEILQPGMLTTVQDQGRQGYQSFGFSQSGVMDRTSYQYGNRLLNNTRGEACLEMAFLGICGKMHGRGIFVLTGAPAEIIRKKAGQGPEHPGESLENGVPFLLEEGDQLHIGAARAGRFLYLGVQGGFDVPLVMGSRSTNLKCSLGGYEGRRLQVGDRISIGAIPSDFKELPEMNARERAWAVTQARAAVPDGDMVSLGVIPDEQEELFTHAGIDTFYHSAYQITEDSDRMGFRLEGPQIQTKAGSDIISEGIAFGAIQVPASGKPIILMADRQTTGGYAKIGTLRTADISLLAQCRAGMNIRFVRADREKHEGSRGTGGKR